MKKEKRGEKEERNTERKREMIRKINVRDEETIEMKRMRNWR